METLRWAVNGIGAMVACVLLLAGCGTTSPAKFYVLSATRDAGAAERARGEKVIGIGPVALPEYLDRAQIVTRSSANRLELADGHRWAEPLAENVTRVLAENLSSLLRTDRVAAYPWKRAQAVDYQVRVQVVQFDGGPDGSVSLVARWSVEGRDGRELAPRRRSSFTVPAAAGNYGALVASHSEALTRLSREVAAELERLMAKP